MREITLRGTDDQIATMHELFENNQYEDLPTVIGNEPFLSQSERVYAVYETMSGSFARLKLESLLHNDGTEQYYSIVDGGIDQILDLRIGEWVNIKYRDAAHQITIRRVK